MQHFSSIAKSIAKYESIAKIIAISIAKSQKSFKNYCKTKQHKITPKKKHNKTQDLKKTNNTKQKKTKNKTTKHMNEENN